MYDVKTCPAGKGYIQLLQNYTGFGFSIETFIKWRFWLSPVQS